MDFLLAIPLFETTCLQTDLNYFLFFLTETQIDKHICFGCCVWSKYLNIWCVWRKQIWPYMFFDQIYFYSDCICLTFLHCVFWDQIWRDVPRLGNRSPSKDRMDDKGEGPSLKDDCDDDLKSQRLLCEKRQKGIFFANCIVGEVLNVDSSF